MSLYLILATFGVIGGTWGPLPYDMNECLARRDEMLTDIRTGMEQNPGAELDGKPLTFSDVVVECREAAVRPELGDAL